MRLSDHLRSSTLHTAVVAALVMWAPGAALLAWTHREWTKALFEEGAAELAEKNEDVLWEVRERRILLEGGKDLGEPLEIEEIDHESLRAFLSRYAARIRSELEHRGGGDLRLEARLAALGETGSEVLDYVALEDLAELMEEEIPEAFHESLEIFIERHIEAREEGIEHIRISAPELLAAMHEEEMEEDSDLCVQVEAEGEPPTGNLTGEPSVLDVGSRFTLLLAEGEADSDDGSTAPWCLVAAHPLSDGGRALIGYRIDARARLIQRSRWLRDLLLIFGLPLALAVGWLQSRPILAFLQALASAARRQSRGEVGARLPISPSGRDLALAVGTVNGMLGQMEQNVQGLSRVSDSIAHDLRTPLSRLQGQLDLLKRSPDPSGELIEAVQDEADQLLETFNALLRIAQVESGAKKQGFRDLDLTEIVQNVAELYAPVFAQKSIAFQLEIPPRPVAIQGDRDLWLQALSNLVENALKYTPEGGEVHFMLDDLGSRPRIRIADNGPGIPEAERENVFRRFYRLKHHRGERGNGLGLSLVGAVCDLHAADIRLGGDRGLIVDIEL